MNTKYSIEDFLETRASGDASFSPDGTKVAYLSTETGTSQVFLIPTGGGKSEQLTDFEDAVSFVRFSPVEEVLIFGKAKGGNEQTRFYLLDLHTRVIVEITSVPDVKHIFGAWSPDGKNICFASNERDRENFDVYMMDIKTRARRCVFAKGGRCVAEGFSPHSTYMVVRENRANADTDLYLCNLETGGIEHITPHDGGVFYSGSLWLPDESAFFLTQDQDREFAGLARYSLIEKTFRYVVTPDWDIGSVAMDRSGKNMAITINEDGYSRMMLCDTSRFETRSYDLPAGSIYRPRFSESGSQVAFNLASPFRAVDLWTLDLATGETRQLTHSHQGVPPEAMVEPELIRFASFDGISIPAFVYKPKGIKLGTKVPVVIDIHGGPAEQYRPTYQPVMQYLVHHGYAVIAPNIRGSSGYGKTYMALDDREKRLDAVKDIVALHEYIAGTPDMNAAKVGLYGASYGGFMVLACMAFYPELWAAGVDIVGIVNFVTFLKNTASYRRTHREAEYGSLEHDRALLERISPVHSIENVVAPLLVIHGMNDPRVPVSEAEQVVAKLKSAEKDVELLVYPDEGHGIAKLKNKRDAYPRIAEFLERTLN